MNTQNTQNQTAYAGQNRAWVVVNPRVRLWESGKHPEYEERTFTTNSANARVYSKESDAIDVARCLNRVGDGHWRAFQRMADYNQ